MKRFRSLLRDIWWLLVFVAVFTAAMVWYVSPFFLVYVPMIAGMLVYFAFVRYDHSGRDRES